MINIPSIAALGVILDQFPKKHLHAWGPTAPPSPLTAEITIEIWNALPLHSVANGLETRRCPCGSHLELALVDFDAPEPVPFGSNPDPSNVLIPSNTLIPER
jgi:hypothetical protein